MPQLYPLVDWGEKNVVGGAANRQSGESNELSEVQLRGVFDAPSRFLADWSCVCQKRARPLFFPLVVPALTDGRASALTSEGAYMVTGRVSPWRYRTLHVVVPASLLCCWSERRRDSVLASKLQTCRCGQMMSC